MDRPSSFNCPTCNALYRLVEVEPGPETVDREIKCCSCGASLASRNGNLVLKYFLVRPLAHKHKLKEEAKAKKGETKLKGGHKKAWAR